MQPPRPSRPNQVEESHTAPGPADGDSPPAGSDGFEIPKQPPFAAPPHLAFIPVGGLLWLVNHLISHMAGSDSPLLVVNKRHECRFRRILKEAIRPSILAFGIPGFAPDEQPSSTQPNDRSCLVLIKKKDVDSYFAARRGRHPLSAKPAGAVPAANSPKVKRSSKTSISAAEIGVPASPAPSQGLHVPFFTSEPGFINSPPPVEKKAWAKS